MTAARASDRHDQVSFALGEVLGQQVVEQRMHVLVERVQLPVAVDELHHARIISGQRPQIPLVVRVGKEADVQEQVGIARRPVLEPEALEGHRHPARRLRGEQIIGQLAAQHRRGEAGRIDHHVRAPAQGSQRVALALDAIGHAPGGRERVTAASLLVPREQRLLVGLEEQHAVRNPARAKVIEHRREPLEVRSAAYVGDDRRARHLGTLVHEQVDERTDHLRGQVVDAEVTLVLEHGHRGRLPGSREAGDHHEVGQGRHLGLSGLFLELVYVRRLHISEA